MNIFELLNEKKIKKKTEAFKKSGMMRYFHYDFGTMADGMTSYTISQEEDEILLIYQENSMTDGREIRSEMYLPPVVMQGIKKLIMDEKIFLWNGFNKMNSVIATGKSFSLKADFDNYKLNASGMGSMPPSYKEKHEIIIYYMKELVKKYYTEISEV